MKKIVSAIALCAAASTFAADAVYSANIVGFQKMDFVPGYNFVGVSFESDQDSGAYSIQEIFETEGLKGGTSATASDQILVWNEDQQVYVRYWLFDSNGNYADYDGKWMKWDGSGLADQQIELGSGFWYVNTASQNVSQVMSGNVNVDASFTYTLGEGYNLIATAYPVSQSVNEMDWSDFTGGTSATSSDQLVFWDKASQKYVRIWLFDSKGNYADYDGKWMKWDGSGLADNQIQSGEAVWAIRKNSGDFDQVKPF